MNQWDFVRNQLDKIDKTLDQFNWSEIYIYAKMSNFRCHFDLETVTREKFIQKEDLFTFVDSDSLLFGCKGIKNYNICCLGLCSQYVGMQEDGLEYMALSVMI